MLAALPSAWAQPEDPVPAGAPLVVLMQKEAAEAPESARFALYADRTVIFREREGVQTATRYMITRRLAEAEYKTLIEKIGPAALGELGESYVAMRDSDLPMHLLLFSVNGSWKKISVFGDLANARARSRLPARLLSALDAITRFSAPAKPWLPSARLPATVKVCLSPASAATEATLPVPPKLPWHFMFKPAGGFQCVYVNNSDFELAYYGVIAQLKPGQHVRLADRNWAVMYQVRLPFQDDWDSREDEHEVVHVPPRPAPSRPWRAPRVAEPSVVYDVMSPLSYNLKDSAAYVLYADGLLIFRAQDTGVPSGYVSRRLSKQQYKELMSAIAPEALVKLDSFTVDSGPDMPGHGLYVWVKGLRKIISITGVIGAADQCKEYPDEFDCKARAGAPQEYLRAYDAIHASLSGPARPWLPPFIELILIRDNPAHRTEPVRAWPAGWPSLEDARAHVNGELRLLLPADQFSRLKELVPNNYRGAMVEIENAPWRLQYHLPLPHEAMWTR